MLRATDEERKHIIDYMSSQVPDETVELTQKVYTENVLTIRHDIWDVHMDQGRWWVITNPTFLYSQEQFPNMDLALTFHVGLCLRVPKSERQSFPYLPVEPLMAAWRALEEVDELLERAEEVEDFQAIGARCREVLLTFVHVAQDLVPTPEGQTKPQRSNFREWILLLANTLLPGSSQENRRALLKSCADAAWKFTAGLTHARGAHSNDAQAAFQSTELVLSLFTTALIRYVRGVPDRCLSCGSTRLAPERGIDPNDLDVRYERPVCGKCGWTGVPVIVEPSPPKPERPPPKGECAIMTTPLRHFPPGRKSGRGDE